jgi:hypothetical protein
MSSCSGPNGEGLAMSSEITNRPCPWSGAVANAKLTDADIRLIFQLRSNGFTQPKIASRIGISQSLTSCILARKRWAHVQLEQQQ